MRTMKANRKADPIMGNTEEHARGIINQDSFYEQQQAALESKATMFKMQTKKSF